MAGKEKITRRQFLGLLGLGALATVLYEFHIPRYVPIKEEIRYPQPGWLDWEIQSALEDPRKVKPLIDPENGPKGHLIQSVSLSPTLGNVMRRVLRKEYLKPLEKEPQRLGDDWAMFLRFAGDELLISHPMIEPSWKDKILVASRVRALARTDYTPFTLKTQLIGTVFESPEAYKAKKAAIVAQVFPRVFPVRPPEGTPQVDIIERFKGTDRLGHLVVGEELADAWANGQNSNVVSARRIPVAASQMVRRRPTTATQAMELADLAANYWEHIETTKKPFGRVPFGWRDHLAGLDVAAVVLGARGRAWLEQEGMTTANVSHVIDVFNDPRVTAPLEYANPEPDLTYFEEQLPLAI